MQISATASVTYLGRESGPFSISYHIPLGCLLILHSFSSFSAPLSQIGNLFTLLSLFAHENAFDNCRHVTRLMALAYRNMFYPLRHIPSEEEARILNIQIYERATDSPGERKAKTREMLKSGELRTHQIPFFE